MTAQGNGRGAAEAEGARRATEVSAAPATAAAPDPQVELPKRRTFTAEYKLRVLQETDAAKEERTVGAILRREGLYSSHLTTWRRERDEGARAALKKKRGRKPTRDDRDVEIMRLRRANAALEAKVEQMKVVIDVQKKVASLLGIPLNAPETGGDDS